jgi:cytochrome c oxidase assembly protein subunit 15
VKHGLVNDSQSLYRLLVMPLHLLNTSLLLCAQVATAESIRFGLNRPSATRKLPSKQVYAIAAGMIILLTSGAIAALGSHLMPSESLIKGLQHDLHSNSHLAVRLRLLHPLLGLLIPMGLWLVIYNSGPLTRSSVIHSSLRRQLTFTLALTVVIGVLTLGFLAPVWLKLSHLTVANLLVIMAARYAYHSSPAPLHSEALHSGTPEHLTEGES